ncbi:MAG: IS110 family transposase [Hyphomicrobiales bacterium]|nr:MAG: IS110 family transposase [Hyphomicrobiales bacterium]
MEQEHGVGGIDPHKQTATIALVAHRGGLRSCESFPITTDGIDALLTYLLDSEIIIERIGVEGSAFLGRPLVLALTAAGYDVREVQANRTAERRSRRRRAKTDAEDAEAIARETLAEPNLPPAGKHRVPNPVWQQLTAIRGWRQSLVLQRVRLLNEAEAVLVGLPVSIRGALPKTSRVLPQLKALAGDGIDLSGCGAAERINLDRLAATLDDVTALTRRIKDLDAKIRPILTALGCTLPTIPGIGSVTAMDLLCEVGDPLRFTNEAQFARWCGAAPVALSSGEGHGPARRHRLDLGGNRAANSILHTVHVTQIRCHPPAQAYMPRQAENHKPKHAARRSHKRQLANVIIRHMWTDAGRDATTPAAAAEIVAV